MGNFKSPSLLKMDDRFVINNTTYAVLHAPIVGRDTTRFNAARQVEANEHAPLGWVFENIKLSNHVPIFVKGVPYG